MANASALLVPGTNFRFLTGTYAASATDIPADTVAYGGAWPAGWTDQGYTDTGIAFTLGRTYQDIMVDQEIDPVVILSTGRDVSVATQFAEFTISKLFTALGYGSTSGVAATSAVQGHDDLVIPGGAPAITNIVAAFEAQAQDGAPFRALFYRANLHANTTVNIRKNATAAIPFTARALPDTSVTPSRVALIRKVRPIGT